VHKVREDVRIKVLEEAVKRPIGRKRQSNVKTAVMGNEQVVVQVIHKVCDHGKTLALHYKEGADHGMVGKAFAPGAGIFRDRRQIQVQEKGVIKFSSRLRSKKPDVVDDFLTVDGNQPPLW